MIGENLLWLTGAACVITWLALFPIRALLTQVGMVDRPNERSSHVTPTARGGGVAIVGVSLVVVLVAAAGDRSFDSRLLFTYTAGAALIAIVSWWDDLRSLPYSARLIAHAVAGVIAVVGLGYWDRIVLPWVGTVELGWLGLPITIVWLIGLTNAYNFMDGIDGIAAGQGVVAGAAWALFGALSNQGLLLILGAALAGSCLGFLPHNWSPARIFMGDVSAAFLGFSFAFMAIAAGKRDPGLIVPGVLLVWPFVFDTTVTLVRRWRRGEDLFAAHREHLYQRLVGAGVSHRRVTISYIVLAAIGAGLAFVWVGASDALRATVVAGLAFLCAMLWRVAVEAERRTRVTA